MSNKYSVISSISLVIKYKILMINCGLLNRQIYEYIFNDTKFIPPGESESIQSI